MNGRTVFVAARPGKFATGVCLGYAVRSGPSPGPAAARGERGVANLQVWSSIDCRLCHAPCTIVLVIAAAGGGHMIFALLG